MDKTKQAVGRPPLISKEEQERWKSVYGINQLNHRAIQFMNQLKQDGILGEDHELAGYLLYNSCQSRINACHYSIGIYTNVICDWSEVSSFWLDINNLKPEVWKEWIRLTEEYFNAGFSNHLRPTLDRINEDVGYNLHNIQALSFAENTKKATSRPQYIFDLIDNSFIKYDSKKEALEFLGLKEESDSGGLIYVNKKPYLLQSEDLSKCKKEFVEREWNDCPNAKTFTAMIPIAQFQLPDGRIATIRQGIEFQQMSIRFKAEQPST